MGSGFKGIVQTFSFEWIASFFAQCDLKLIPSFDFLTKTIGFQSHVKLPEMMPGTWKSLYLCKIAVEIEWWYRESMSRHRSTRKTIDESTQIEIEKIFWKVSDFKNFRLLEIFFYFVSNKNKLVVFFVFFNKNFKPVSGVWSDVESA